MQGKWICARPEVETVMFRKTFEAHDIESAEIDVSGLGFFFHLPDVFLNLLVDLCLTERCRGCVGRAQVFGTAFRVTV